jgi:ABC-2 type transport system ATP-binding protein
MDVAARHSFWESMREFTGQGKTVVFATHYLDEADTFADRIVILTAGRIIADGTPSEVKSVVSGRTMTFTLVGGTESEFLALPGVTSFERRGSRVFLHTENSDASLRELLRDFPSASDLEIVSRNMDDAFMALTSASTQKGN